MTPIKYDLLHLYYTHESDDIPVYNSSDGIVPEYCRNSAGIVSE